MDFRPSYVPPAPNERRLRRPAPGEPGRATNAGTASAAALGCPAMDAPLLAPTPLHDEGSVLFFALLAPLVAALFVSLVVRAEPAWRWRAPLLAAAWLALTASVARSGFLARLDLVPPPAALLIVAALGLALAIGCSRAGGALAARTPMVHLIGLQAFRLSLELGMHRASSQGIMPGALTWTGFNLDILSGLSAAVLALAMLFGARVPRALIWAWNVWGLACLTMIAVLAVLLSPMVHAFGTGPAKVNTWVLFLPYVWLPAVLVPVALASHIVLTRQLLASRPR